MPGLDPGIHVFLDAAKTWMAGTSPAMTESVLLAPNARSAMEVAGVSLLADLSGALFWQEQRLLVVSDLHLEKGSSFATRGVLLPPYDTVATLGRLAAVIARHDPRMVMKDGKPSANMFAAGEIMAGNVLGKGYAAGIGMTIGSVFGRVAGREAAKNARN